MTFLPMLYIVQLGYMMTMTTTVLGTVCSFFCFMYYKDSWINPNRLTKKQVRAYYKTLSSKKN